MSLGWPATFGIACLLVSSEVRADRVAVVAVDRCGSPPLAAEVQTLREAVAGIAGNEVRSFEQTAERLGGVSKLPLSDLSRVIVGARYELTDQAGYERVLRTMTAALTDLKAIAPSTDRWTDEREALSLQAFAYLKLGRKPEAHNALAKVLRIDPDFQPDARTYPPSFRDFAEAVRGTVARQMRAALVVNSEPAGGTVFIDGKPTGSSPLTIPLPPRDYRIEVSWNGRRGLPRDVTLPRQGVQTFLEQKFDGAIDAAAGPCFDSGEDAINRAAGLVRLGKVLNVDTVMGLRSESESAEARYLVGSVVKVSTGEELREGRVKQLLRATPDEGLSQLGHFLATGQAVVPVEEVRVDRARRVANVGGATDGLTADAAPLRSPWLRNAGYMAGGAALVAATMATVLHLQASGLERQLAIKQVGEGTNTFSAADAEQVASLKRGIAGRRTVFYVATGVAVVTAATAATLYFVTRAPTLTKTAVVVSPIGIGLRGQF